MKEIVVAFFNVLLRYLSGGTEENQYWTAPKLSSLNFVRVIMSVTYKLHGTDSFRSW
jgi:hypothetical protein